MSAIRAILGGGLIAGALDLIDALVFFGARSGAGPVGILHSIAAGGPAGDADSDQWSRDSGLGVGLPIAYFASRMSR